MYVAAVTERRTWEVREKRCRQAQPNLCSACNRIYLPRPHAPPQGLIHKGLKPLWSRTSARPASTPPPEIRHTGLMIAVNWQSVVSVRKATPLYSWLGTTGRAAGIAEVPLIDTRRNSAGVAGWRDLIISISSAARGKQHQVHTPLTQSSVSVHGMMQLRDAVPAVPAETFPTICPLGVVVLRNRKYAPHGEGPQADSVRQWLCECSKISIISTPYDRLHVE